METAWIIAIAAVVWFLGLIAFFYLLNVAGQVYRGAVSLCSRGHGARPLRCGTDERGMEDEVRRQAGGVKEKIVARGKNRPGGLNPRATGQSWGHLHSAHVLPAFSTTFSVAVKWAGGSSIAATAIR